MGLRWTGGRLLVAIAAFFAVLAISGMALLVRADYRATLAEAENHHVVLAQLIEEHARRTFETTRVALRDIGKGLVVEDKIQVDAAATARIRRWASEFPQIYAIWIFDENGRALFCTLPVDVSGRNYADRPYFQAHRGGQDLYVGGLFFGPFSRNWIFSLSQRLTDARGNFRGIVLATMRADYFMSLYSRLGLPDEDNIDIYRLDGTVVVQRPPKEPADRGVPFNRDPPFDAHAFERRIGVIRSAASGDGVDRLTAFRAMDGWPLVVASGADIQSVLAPWRWRTISNAVYCLAGLALLAGLTTWGYRQIRRQELVQGKNEVLLNEVHHRVKNNLAIIQSLLALEAARVPPEARQGYEDSIARVQAMGLVHQLLYHHQIFAGINAAEYLQQLCGIMEDSAPRVRIDIDAQSLEVDLDTAMPMALIATEIVTNAIKHAFADGRSGTIQVRLRQEGRRAALTIHDDGIGLPAGIGLEGRGGLGLVLVRRLVRQIGGEARLENLNGTLFTLSFPVGEEA